MKGWAPIGVVCAIVPWNFPLMLFTWKVSLTSNPSPQWVWSPRCRCARRWLWGTRWC